MLASLLSSSNRSRSRKKQQPSTMIGGGGGGDGDREAVAMKENEPSRWANGKELAHSSCKCQHQQQQSLNTQERVDCYTLQLHHRQQQQQHGRRKNSRVRAGKVAEKTTTTTTTTERSQATALRATQITPTFKSEKRRRKIVTNCDGHNDDKKIMLNLVAQGSKKRRRRRRKTNICLSDHKRTRRTTTTTTRLVVAAAAAIIIVLVGLVVASVTSTSTHQKKPSTSSSISSSSSSGTFAKHSHSFISSSSASSTVSPAAALFAGNDERRSSRSSRISRSNEEEAAAAAEQQNKTTADYWNSASARGVQAPHSLEQNPLEYWKREGSNTTSRATQKRFKRSAGKWWWWQVRPTNDKGSNDAASTPDRDGAGKRAARGVSGQLHDSSTSAAASTRILAVSGRPVELQCPLANELRALTNTAAAGSSSSSASSQSVASHSTPTLIASPPSAAAFSAAGSSRVRHTPTTTASEIQHQLHLNNGATSSAVEAAAAGVKSSSSASSSTTHSIIWRKNGVRLDQLLNFRHKINPLNGSLVINSAQRDLDEANYECALVEHHQQHLTSIGKQKQQNDSGDKNTENADDKEEENQQGEQEEEAEGEEKDGQQQQGKRIMRMRELKWHRFELRLIVAPKLAPFEFPSSAQVGMKVVLTCSALEGEQPLSFVWLKDNQLISEESGTMGPAAPGTGKSMSSQSFSKTTDLVSSGGAQTHAASTLNQVHQQQLADKALVSVHKQQEQQQAFSNNRNSAQATVSSSNRFSLNEYSLLPSPTLMFQEQEDELDEQQDAGGASMKNQNGAELNGSGLTAGNLNPIAGSSSASSSSSSRRRLLPLLWDANVRIKQADDYSILSIDKLELKHSGRYTCSVQNEAARTSHSSQLVINAPPTLTVEPKDTDLVAGQSGVIECAASGQPRPTISWLRARELSNKQWDYVAVYDNLRFSILSNGSLAIANVTQREQGYYLCSAKNGFGPEVSKLIKISVHEPPKFSSKFKTLEVRVEERASITCLASGEQPISIDWFDKDSKLISRKDKKFIIDETLSHSSGDQGAGTGNSTPDYSKSSPQPIPANTTAVSRLMLAKTSRQDSGHYTCEANNKYGSDKMVTNLLIQDVPDRVSELKVTNTTSSTISLRWQLAFSGNSPVTSYLVQYQSDDPLDDLLLSSSSSSTAGAAFTLQPPPSSSDTSTFNSQATMAADLQQQLEVSGGTTAHSNSNSSPTTSWSLKSILDALNNLAAGSSSSSPSTKSSTAEIGGTTSSSVAAIESTEMQSTAANAADDEMIDRTLVELTVEQSSTHLVVKDLSAFCVYRLRLAAINKLGLGEFSEWIRAKTEEAPPGGVALKVGAAATGPNSIKLTWLVPDRRTWNGQLTGFNIRYRPLDSSFELNKTIDWSPNIGTATAAAAGVISRSSNSPPLILPYSTGQHSMKPTHLLQQQQPVTHSATELMQSTYNNNSNQSDHGLKLSGNKKFLPKVIQNNSTKQTNQQQQQQQHHLLLRQQVKRLLALQQQELVAHLTNLQRSTTYLVSLEAINARGLGPQSSSISVKTLDDVPPSAPALRIHSTSASSITIGWSMMSNFVSLANQYSLFYRRAAPPPALNQATSTNFSSSSSAAFMNKSTSLQNTNTNNNNLMMMMMINGDAIPAQQLDFYQQQQQSVSESAAFIERTISSQQLMMLTNSGLFSPAANNHQQQDQMQLQQQQQQQQQQQHFLYTLDQLACGSVYELYMTTRNSVGKSEPSPVITTRTLGEPPQAPANKNALFARIAINEAALNLASWSTGGCPLTHITLRYKQSPAPAQVSTSNATAASLVSVASSSGVNSTGNSSSSSSSQSPQSPGGATSAAISISLPSSLVSKVNQMHHHQQQQQSLDSSGESASASARQTTTLHSQQHDYTHSELQQQSMKLQQQQQQQEPFVYLLKNLAPSTCYELEVIAYNAAGHTSSQYEFVTGDASGTRVGGLTRGTKESQLAAATTGGAYRWFGEAQDQQQQQRFNPSNGGGSSEQSSLNNQLSGGGSGNQLLPLLLMALCLVCLIISSSFCYYRLKDSWLTGTQNNNHNNNLGTRHHHGSSSLHSCSAATTSATTLDLGGGAGGGLTSGSGVGSWPLEASLEAHCKSSPHESAAASMWARRLNAGIPAGSNTLKNIVPSHHHHHPNVHYCARSGALTSGQLSLDHDERPTTNMMRTTTNSHTLNPKLKLLNNHHNHHNHTLHHRHHHHLPDETDHNPDHGAHNSTFSQSVSMKDFNLVLGQAPASTLSGSGVPELSTPPLTQVGGLASLKQQQQQQYSTETTMGRNTQSGFKTLGHSHQHHNGGAELIYGGAEQKQPLASGLENYASCNDLTTVNAVYAAACKQQQQQKRNHHQATYLQQQTSSFSTTPSSSSVGAAGATDNGLCNGAAPFASNLMLGTQPFSVINYSQLPGDQRIYGGVNNNNNNNMKPVIMSNTNYATPQNVVSSSNYSSSDQQQQHFNHQQADSSNFQQQQLYQQQQENQQQQVYSVDQTTIDACIQQFMSQQQQQQQEQQYEMIVNMKLNEQANNNNNNNNRCQVYGGANNNNNNIYNPVAMGNNAQVQEQQYNLSHLNGNHPPHHHHANTSSSIIDSCSGSSGIELINCSTTAATAAQETNTSSGGGVFLMADGNQTSVGTTTANTTSSSLSTSHLDCGSSATGTILSSSTNTGGGGAGSIQSSSGFESNEGGYQLTEPPAPANNMLVQKMMLDTHYNNNNNNRTTITSDCVTNSNGLMENSINLGSI